MSLRVRFYEPSDEAEWLRMRRMLWPYGSQAAPHIEMVAWLAGADAAVLVAERAHRQRLALPLEGRYVDLDVRRHGIGAALVRAAELWARQRADPELASDALVDAINSQRAHESLGFIEVERAVRYRKAL